VDEENAGRPEDLWGAGPDGDFAIVEGKVEEFIGGRACGKGGAPLALLVQTDDGRKVKVRIPMINARGRIADRRPEPSSPATPAFGGIGGRGKIRQGASAESDTKCRELVR
jgi:hypothetical protein